MEAANRSDSKEFEVGFLGFGVSSAALVLKEPERFSGKNILIVDPNLESKQKSLKIRGIDKNICSLGIEEDLTGHDRVWTGWQIHLQGRRTLQGIRSYHCTKANHLMQKAYEILLKLSARLTVITGKASQVCSSEEGFSFLVDSISEEQNKIGCLEIFDSRNMDLSGQENKILWQHFYGQEFEMEQAHGFESPVLMDLYPSAKGLEFFYILPLSPTKLFVELTYFSKMASNQNWNYSDRLVSYVNKIGAVKSALRESIEKSRIPLISVINSIEQMNYYPLGARSGKLRAATGYSFAASYHHGIVRPKRITQKVRSWFDGIFLRVLSSHPELSFEVFEKFLKAMPASRLASFLSYQPQKSDYLFAVLAMPKILFLKSVISKNRCQIRTEVEINELV